MSQNPEDPQARAQREALQQARQFLEAQKHDDAQAAADPANNPNPPGFDAICREYVLRDTWTLDEAAILLNACRPERGRMRPEQEQLNTRILRTHKFLVSCLGVSLTPVGGTPRVLKGRTRIKVKEVWALAEAKGLELPATLAAAFKWHFLKESDDQPHGNAIRYQQIREAAYKEAERLLQSHPRRFRNASDQPSISALAKHLASHPKNWAPTLKDGGTPLHVDSLRRILRNYFRGQGGQ